MNLKTSLKTKVDLCYAHWDGTTETEEKIKEETKATIRCIPLIANPKMENVFIPVSHQNKELFLQGLIDWFF